MSYDSNPFSVQMAASRDGFLVTEGMLTEAARAGDLESLMVLAGQGVRVRSGKPLLCDARGRSIAVLRCLVHELGADVNQASLRGLIPGSTPLIQAI
jgi:hypothetical protein